MSRTGKCLRSFSAFHGPLNTDRDMTATNASSFEGHSGEALPPCSFWLTFSLTVSTTEVAEKGRCPPFKTNASTNLDLRRMIYTSQMLEVFVWVRQAINRLERRKYGKHNSQREAWHDDEFIRSHHIEKKKRLLLILKSHGKNNYSHMGFPSMWTDVWQNSNSSFLRLFALVPKCQFEDRNWAKVRIRSLDQDEYKVCGCPSGGGHYTKPQHSTYKPMIILMLWHFILILYWTILSCITHQTDIMNISFS